VAKTGRNGESPSAPAGESRRGNALKQLSARKSGDDAKVFSKPGQVPLRRRMRRRQAGMRRSPAPAVPDPKRQDVTKW